MSIQALKSVSLVNSVLFDGQQKTQLVSAYGVVLELIDGVTVRASAPPSKKRSPKMIPLSNVRDYEILGEAEALAELQKELLAQTAAQAAKVTAANKAAEAKAPKAKGGFKFVKDETGAIREEQT